MKLKELLTAVAAPGFLVLSMSTEAQTASTAPTPVTKSSALESSANDNNLEEIIVTARRISESVMDVPQTVNSVSGAQLQEFNILKFEDISQLVPGLTLTSDNSGFRAIATVRGVSFEQSTQATPTVEVYFNEVPVDPNLMFQGNFDIGQVEVLRGPQGTLRGRSAPSGSITQSSRRPDLMEFGTSVSATFNNHSGTNIQGALGMPIIEDKLAFRLAALFDRNDAGGVESVNNPKDPQAETKGFRGSLRFEPTDTIATFLMYQHLERVTDAYGDIVFGPGATGVNTAATTTLPAVVAPANFNGPPLVGEDRKSILEFPRHVEQTFDIVTLQTDWSFAGQQLSYVGGYSRVKIPSLNDNDSTNSILGRYGPIEDINSFTDRWTHEVRLSSEERLFGLMDYTVGAYYGKYGVDTVLGRPDTQVLAGAFGSPLGTAAPGGPGVLSPSTYDTRYANDLSSHSTSTNIEKSLFANLMFHLNDKTELSVGGRKIFSNNTKAVDATTTAGIQAVQNPNGLGACPATIGGLPVVGSTYAGTCDVRPVAPTLLRSVPKTSKKENPFVYSASASYHFTPDFMTYASYGTSWRAGPGPITGAPVCSAVSTPGIDPTLCDKFNILDSEKSKGVEIGIKSALLDRRINISLALYNQQFDNYINYTTGGATPYLAGTCGTPLTAACRVTTGNFTYNGDVEVRGVDAEVNYRVNQNLNIGSTFSWSKGRFKTSIPIPCRDQLDANGNPGFDGVPDSGALLTAAQWLALGGPYGPTLCNVKASSSTTPPWNANLRGEYSHSIFPGGLGFIRALFNYYPKNTNRGVANVGFVTESYQLLNLFTGVRSEDGIWEVTLGGNNILNNQTVLTQALGDGVPIVPQTGRTFGASSGYRTVTYTPRREFTLNLRYAFGSR